MFKQIKSYTLNALYANYLRVLMNGNQLQLLDVFITVTLIHVFKVNKWRWQSMSMIK